MELRELAESALKSARDYIDNEPDGPPPAVVTEDAQGVQRVFLVPFRNDAEKQMMIMAARLLMIVHDVQRYAFSGEAWMVLIADGKMPSVMPRDDDRRRSMVYVSAEDRSGEHVLGYSQILTVGERRRCQEEITWVPSGTSTSHVGVMSGLLPPAGVEITEESRATARRALMLMGVQLDELHVPTLQ